MFCFVFNWTTKCSHANLKFLYRLDGIRYSNAIDIEVIASLKWILCDNNKVNLAVLEPV